MNLKPVDFKAVAAKGCFVYCYLRADGSPYYIGLASRWRRPLEKDHSVFVPPVERIVVLRSGLSWDQACEWEIFYIAHYGRVCDGTGCLRNLTLGGEGCFGYFHTPESRQRLSKSAKARGVGSLHSPEARAKAGISNAKRLEQKRAAEADRLGITVSQLLQQKAQENARRSGRNRQQRKKALGMTRQGFSRWIADGKPMGDLSRYQEPVTPNHVKTEAHKQKLSQATTAFFERKAAEQGLTLEEAKAAARRRKYECLMASARAMGMSRRQYQAFARAQRQAEAAA